MEKDCSSRVKEKNDCIRVLIESMKVVSEGLFDLFFNWRKTCEENTITESDIISQCFLQLALCKLKSLLALCNGISITPKDEDLKVYDIPSLISILRSLYELTFIFHNIYAEQDTEIERDIVLCIWQIRGLNNRQNLSVVPEMFKEKEKAEREYLCELRDKAEKLADKLIVSKEIRNQLHRVFSSPDVDIKGYRFKKDSCNNQIISFDDVRFNEGAESMLKMDVLTYRLFSIHGHPSYLGVLQFGQMFNSTAENDFLRTILTCACKLGSTMAIDFRNNIIGADKIFSQLKDNVKNTVAIFLNN